MRHFRMSSENIKNLTFKKQICSSKEVNKCDEIDKNKTTKCTRIEKIKTKSDGGASSSVLPKPSRTRGQGFDKKNNNYKSKVIKKHVKNNVFIRRSTLCCKICNVKKRSIKNFLHHLNTHLGTPISCRNCKKDFNGRPAFNFHVTNVCGKIFLPRTAFKCHQCSREFKFKRHYLSHVEGHKKNNCKYCDMVFTNKRFLLKHLNEKHSLKSLASYVHKCNHCDKRYVQKRSLYCHIRQHVPGKHVCLDCGLVIENLHDYKIHADMHYKEKKWECPKCKLRFQRRQHFYIHLKKHDLYKCITCNSTFSSRIITMQHKKKGHLTSGLEPKFLCPICPKVYYRCLTLQKHIKRHNEISLSFSCKRCNRTFASQNQYYKHCLRIVHEKNSPDVSELLCEICGKNFNKKYMLDDHMYRYHSKKEALTCPYCDYKTTNKTNMKRHSVIHMPSEDYICEQCGKHFTNMFSLKEHVSYSHVQIRQNKCDECDKSFKRKSELSRHKKVHSDERPYVCKLCGSSYKRNTHLKRHEKSAHKGNLTDAFNKSKKICEDQSLNIYELSVPDLISNGIPEVIPNIDQNMLNETFWTNKIDTTEDTFNNSSYQVGNCIPDQIQYNSGNLNDIEQLVASYIPDKSNFFNETYNVQFNNVIIQGVLMDNNLKIN